MGFDKSSDVIKNWIEIAGGENGVIYRGGGGGGGNGDERAASASSIVYPPDTRFEAVLLDVPSRAPMSFARCTTGRDVLRYWNEMVRTDAMQHGARVHVFCFDDTRYVSTGKIRERAKRREAQQASNVRPYEIVTFKNGTRRPVRLEDFEFDFGELPDDFPRMLATPTMMLKWNMFVGDLLCNYVCHPSRTQHTIIVRGLRTSAQPGVPQVSIKTVYMPPRSPTAAAAVATANNDDDDTGLKTHGAHFQNAKRYTDNDKLPYTGPLDQHVDQHVRAVVPTETIGESEILCFHQARVMMLERQCSSMLVRANDSDALLCGLLMAGSLIKDGEQRVSTSLFIDYTARGNDQRAVDIVQLWRRLSQAVLRLGGFTGSSGPRLASPIEVLMFFSILTGNDYCEGLSRLGPGTIFGCVKTWLLRSCAQSAQPLVLFNEANGDMLTNEPLALELIAQIYMEMKQVKDAARELRLVARGDEANMRRFFDLLAAHFANKLQREVSIKLAANQDPRGIQNAALRLKPYDAVRAEVRRAFYALFYYRNSCYGVTMPDSMESFAGTSLYGYGATEDSPCEFVNLVATDQANFRSLNPFVFNVAVPPPSQLLLPRSSSATTATTSTRLKVKSASSSASSCSSVTSPENSVKRKSGEIDEDGVDGERKRMARSLPHETEIVFDNATPLRSVSQGARTQSARSSPVKQHSEGADDDDDTVPNEAWLYTLGADGKRRSPHLGEYRSFLVSQVNYINVRACVCARVVCSLFYCDQQSLCLTTRLYRRRQVRQCQRRRRDRVGKR
jgi:hypothetical protein